MPFNRRTQNLIADLRGVPRDMARSYVREVSSLNTLLERIQEKYRIGEVRTEEIIMRNWKTIVGDENAHRCSPEKILGEDTLVIYVSNPTLRNELQFNQRRILKRLQAIPQCERIRKLSLRQR